MLTLLFDFKEIFHDLVANLSVGEVLKYFGIICMCLMPVLFLINQYYLWKENRERTGDKPAPKEDKKTDKTSDDKEAKAETEKKAEEEKKEEPEEEEFAGISPLVLRVDDRYRCILSEHELRNHTGGRGEDLCWKVTDPFVAEVSENSGLLTARKCGRTVVEFNNAEIYALTVVPRYPGWPFEKDWDLLLNGALQKEADRQIRLRRQYVKAASDDEVWTFKSGDILARYAYDKEERLCAMSFEIPDGEQVESGIEERFQKLFPEADADGCTYWYRMGIDPETENYCVTFVLFVRVRNGKTIIGMGRVWREGCAEDEIKENVKMIRRSLERVLDPEDVPASVGEELKDPKKPRRKAQVKKAAPVQPEEKDDDVKENVSEDVIENDDKPASDDGSENDTDETPDGSADLDEDDIPDPNDGGEENEDGDDYDEEGEGGEEGFYEDDRNYE